MANGDRIFRLFCQGPPQHLRKGKAAQIPIDPLPGQWGSDGVELDGHEPAALVPDLAEAEGDFLIWRGNPVPWRHPSPGGSFRIEVTAMGIQRGDDRGHQLAVGGATSSSRPLRSSSFTPCI